METFSDALLKWIEKQGGFTLLDMVRYCEANFGRGMNKSVNIISELIVDGRIEGDRWEGFVLWKVKE